MRLDFKTKRDFLALFQVPPLKVCCYNESHRAVAGILREPRIDAGEFAGGDPVPAVEQNVALFDT
jgi:hypothetical protein